ncbi:MAG: ATP-binding cassette domain-containing protein [Microthrixaceae bacterium]
MIDLLSVRGLGVRRDGATLLEGVDWAVHPGERWVVLGPNGCGKTTLVRVATWWERPSAGRLTLLGHRLGRADVRRVRTDVGFVSAGFAKAVRPQLTAHEFVVSARHGALEPWWHHYEPDDHRRADEALADTGAAHVADRAFGLISSGERQRVMLARALFSNTPLIVLDEPSAGLDLAGREDLVGRLEALAADPNGPAQVLVTHHVEEIPPSFTHVLLMRAGRVTAAGAIGDVLSARALSDTFDIQVCLDRADGRFSARAAT